MRGPAITCGYTVPAADKGDEGVFHRVGGHFLVTGYDCQGLDQAVEVVGEDVFGAAVVHVLPGPVIARQSVAQAGHAPGIQERCYVRAHLTQLGLPISIVLLPT